MLVTLFADVHLSNEALQARMILFVRGCDEKEAFLLVLHLIQVQNAEFMCFSNWFGNTCSTVYILQAMKEKNFHQLLNNPNPNL